MLRLSLRSFFSATSTLPLAQRLINSYSLNWAVIVSFKIQLYTHSLKSQSQPYQVVFKGEEMSQVSRGTQKGDLLPFSLYSIVNLPEIQISMLSSQHRLQTLLKKQRPSPKERDQVLKLIREGRYDLPESVLEQAFTLLKHSHYSENRFYHTSDILQAGLELKIGTKLKGYLIKFREALGDVPSINKIAAFIDFTLSTEPSAQTFDDLIVEDRTNYDTRKQSICVLKTTYDWDDYVKKINEYLKENPSDAEAWLELGDIYTERSQYLRALFCFQQVVMLSPDNDYYFLRLAELYYTDGGKSNLPTAIKYFAYVVSRNPRNPRALWGLYRSLWVQRDVLEETDRQLLEKTKDSIQKLYSTKMPSLKIHLAI